MRSRKTFLYYLCDSANAGNFYVDVNGILQTTNIPTPLKHSPEGWLNNELKFGRSQKYYGINRSFSVPMKFVGDGADIIRSLFYNKRGIEQQIMIIILKWNPDDDTYYLYYKGLLDLSRINDEVAEGVTVNVMEGGVLQLLKAYENTIFEIPCDGSIPENIKVNLDGVLLEDTFHHQFIPFTSTGDGEVILPTVFISNEGDNIGIIRGDQNLEAVPTFNYFSTSANFIFSSVEPITVRLKGSITLKPQNSNQQFNIFLVGSYATQGTGGITNRPSLVPNNGPASGPSAFQVINSQSVYNFDVSITLQANEKLFIVFVNIPAQGTLTIVSGDISLSFNSSYHATRCWTITAYDLFKLLVKNICQTAGTTHQQFNYGADSQLLQQYLNLTVTSGDALRASGDSSYNKFYNAIQNNVNYPNINNYYSYGPVIKTTLAEFFDAFNPVLGAALSNQRLPGEKETLFFEKKGYVFDPSVVTMDLGEVRDLKVSVATEYFFNLLDIGYPLQQYDEKAGKYEYNTTAHWVAPIKSLSKKLELISKYRADSYGIEKTRFDGGGKSITQNQSDNSVFIINVDYSSFVPDYFKASFTSPITDTSKSNNTNIKLLTSMGAQALPMNTYDGSYLLQQTLPGVFIFNQPGLALSMAGTAAFDGNINGKVGDSITIKLWLNGAVLQSWTFAVTSASTPISATYNFTRVYNYLDNLYFTVDTSVTCVAYINSVSLVVGSPYLNAAGTAISIPSGSGEVLLALPQATITQISSRPVVSTGFQFFIFNDILLNSDFSLIFDVAGKIQGATDQVATFYLFVNGTQYASANFNATTTQTTFSTSIGIASRNFKVNDIIWVVVSVQNLTLYITAMDLILTSKTIKAYGLKRKKYGFLNGVPNKTLTTDVAGAPYNIEDLTPKRMLKNWGNWIRSVLFNQIPEVLAFHSLDKNQFLITDDVIENANVDISSFDAPLFYPLVFDFKTKVPISFYNLLLNSANGHIKFSYNGKVFYGFPMEVTQKATLNESQEWKLLCSPLVNMQDLTDLDIDGLNFLHLMPSDMFFSHLAPLQVVPLNGVQNARYNFIHMDNDWFINQVKFWIHKSNYYQKVQTNDTVPMQIITNGIASASMLIYDCNAKLVATVPAVAPVSSPLQPPYVVLEGIIDPTALSLAEGVYYVAFQGGSATPGISEGFQVKANWANTLLFEYYNDVNKQSTIFSSGYRPSFRVEGWIDSYSPESRFVTYEDQPADLELLNAIPHSKFKLNIVAPDGVPDWVIRKIDRIMLLNNVTIDGKKFTRETDAKWEVKTADKWPKRYWTLEIREAVNRDGLTLSQDATVNNGVSIVYNIDASAFGENSGVANVIQVNGQDN